MKRHRALHRRQVRGLVRTQNGEAALAVAAEASGLPVAQCDVYKLLLGRFRPARPCRLRSPSRPGR